MVMEADEVINMCASYWDGRGRGRCREKAERE